MQILEILNRLSNIMEQARSVPFTKGAVVDRDEVLDLLDALRAELPEEIEQADVILADRKAVLDDAKNKAERMIAEAERQVQNMLSKNTMVNNVQTEVEATRSKVEAELARMREETDEYIDARLATLEVALARTMAAIQRGRERLNGKHPYDALAPADESELPAAS
jgi:cell division septum initiation protein DivIVA